MALNTTQAQGAYTQHIRKEQAQVAPFEKKNMEVLDVFLSASGLEPTVFSALRRRDSYFSKAQIGSNLQSTTLPADALKRAASTHQHRADTRYQSSFIYKKVFAKENGFNPKAPRDTHFTQEMSRNRPAAQDEFIAPLRSSDAIGWLPATPLPVFTQRSPSS